MSNVQNTIADIDLPQLQFKDILCHVYRSKDGAPDLEGMLVPFALALFVKFQIETCEGEWNPPNIVFGADLREISDGIPLYDIYSTQFRKELEFLGLSPNCCYIFTPNNFDRYPIDTLTELQAFQYYKWIEGRENDPNSLCFSREPHQDRIRYLCDQHKIKTQYLSAEKVITEILKTSGMKGSETMERYFSDTPTFKMAELKKMVFMLLLDRSGEGLAFISRFTKLKNKLLDFAGHKS